MLYHANRELHVRLYLLILDVYAAGEEVLKQADCRLPQQWLLENIRRTRCPYHTKQSIRRPPVTSRLVVGVGSGKWERGNHQKKKAVLVRQLAYVY